MKSFLSSASTSLPQLHSIRDKSGYKEGPPEDTNPDDSHFNSAPPTAAAGLGKITNSLCIKIPMAIQQMASQTTTKQSRSVGKENNITMRNRPGSSQTTIKGAGFILHLNTNPSTKTPFEANKTAGSQEELSDKEDEGTESQHTSCHADYHKAIVNMMEQHYCAHLVIPGYAALDPRAIKRWAVQQIYNLCTKHGLPEVWAYLWENWYRKGRWCWS